MLFEIKNEELIIIKTKNFGLNYVHVMKLFKFDSLQNFSLIIRLTEYDNWKVNKPKSQTTIPYSIERSSIHLTIAFICLVLYSSPVI